MLRALLHHARTVKSEVIEMSLRKRLVSLGAIAAMGSPLASFAATDPYVTVVAATAVNICMVRHGYITSEDGAKYLVEYAKGEGISPDQVSNIMENPSFWRTTEKAIEGQGGCSRIIAMVMGRTRKSTRSVSGTSQMDPKTLYGAIDPKSFNLDRPYQPNIKKYLN